MNKTVVEFHQKQIRRSWKVKEELWYFSIIDIVKILTDSSNPRRYWSDLKKKLKQEGSEVYDEIVQLRMKSPDGKYRKTDTGNTETVFRIIQSIPSPKAEPLKMWLAQVGYERVEEINDPELSFERAMRTYLKKGYSKDWINQRLKSIEVRKELTDEWKERGMKSGYEFGILTNEITKAWTGKNVKDLKKYKGLKKENLRDNMSNLELILNMLAEASTTEISKDHKPEGLSKNKEVAQKGGTVAKLAKEKIEDETKTPIIKRK